MTDVADGNVVDVEKAKLIETELFNAMEEAALKAETSRRWQLFWKAADVAFGLPAAVLATISGLTGLASTAGRVPAAILSLVAAGCLAASTFLQCGTRADAARRKKKAWRVLEADARMARIDTHGDPLAMRSALLALVDRRKLLLAGDLEGAMQLEGNDA